jgi:hypothetical protein
MGKRSTIVPKTKLKIIADLERGRPQKEISVHYGISLASVSVINKRKSEIRERIERNFATHKKVKNIRSAKFVKLEEALLLFIHQMRDRKLPISRALINAKAKEYAAKLGNISSSTTPSKTFHS